MHDCVKQKKYLPIISIMTSLMFLQPMLGSFGMGKQRDENVNKSGFCRKRKRVAGAHATDERGWTRLHAAVANGDGYAVAQLLKEGADVEVVDKYGDTPLSLAVKNDYKVIITLLEAYAIKDDWTPLHFATRKGDEEAVEFLLNTGVDRDVVDKDRWVSLHWAVKGRFKAVVKLFLKAGVDCNVRNNNDETPLYLAAKNGDAAIVKLLLAYRANPNIIDKGHQNPLHVASAEGHEFIVSMLLDAGADKDAITKRGFTPLCLAVQESRKGVVEELLNAKANVEHEDVFGKTVLSKALTAYFFSKPAIDVSSEIITILLLSDGNASLKNVHKLFQSGQNLLKILGFDHDTFEKDLKESRELLRKYKEEGFVKLLPECLPQALGKIIVEYHDCVKTRMIFFQKVRASYCLPALEQ